MGHHRAVERAPLVMLIATGLTVASTLNLTACTATTPAHVRRVTGQEAARTTEDAAELLDPHLLVLTLVGTADCPAEVAGARESVGGEVVVEAAGHAHHTCAGPAEAASWRITTRADLTAAGGPRAVTVYRTDRVLSVPVTGPGPSGTDEGAAAVAGSAAG